MTTDPRLVDINRFRAQVEVVGEGDVAAGLLPSHPGNSFLNIHFVAKLDLGMEA